MYNFFTSFSGQVTDLASQHVCQVAAGKAHIVALSSSHEVFTFGMNNKGALNNNNIMSMKISIYVDEDKYLLTCPIFDYVVT